MINRTALIVNNIIYILFFTILSAQPTYEFEIMSIPDMETPLGMSSDGEKIVGTNYGGMAVYWSDSTGSLVLGIGEAWGISENDRIFAELENSDGNWEAALIENEEITFRAKVVIDASGFQSVVSKSLGLVKQWKRFGVGAEYEAEVENVNPDTWWLMVGQIYSPAGYAWIFPLGKNLVRIGVGVGKPESEVDPTERLDELIEKGAGPIKDLGKITKKEFHYGLIPNEGLSRKTVYDNLILVGDTAGMANPLVLEGIRYAIKYGRVAGDVASKAIKLGDTSEEALQSYEETWKKEIDPKIKSAHKVQAKWLKLSDDDWDKEIGIISNLSADEFLDFIRADFTVSKMVKLATHHPMLAVRQFFNIIKGA